MEGDVHYIKDLFDQFLKKHQPQPQITQELIPNQLGIS